MGVPSVELYQRHLRQQIARIEAHILNAGLTLHAELTPCPFASGYRSQGTFELRTIDQRSRVLGTHPIHGKVPLSDCLWVFPEEKRAAIAQIAQQLEESPESGATGFEIRLQHGGPGSHVTISVPRNSSDAVFQTAEMIHRATPDSLGVAVPAKGIEIGATHIPHRVRGRTLQAHYKAFFQTNSRLTEALVDEVQARVGNADRVVDIYCGVGLHSLLAAQPGSAIAGVDNNRFAIASAQMNAQLSGIAAAVFVADSAEHFVAGRPLDRPSMVFVNPSRHGCGQQMVRAIAGWQPSAVCLISCSLDAHVRDLVEFGSLGFRARTMACFDMFPFANFLESVSLLEPS